ncbi:MAG: cobaltochelatase subunit CobN, partial [Hyphomicrobium sp.]
MHVIFRESHGLEETERPVDLGQDPADLVVLSYSDSDLGAFAGGWRRGRDRLPSLRLANLVALRHPLSVDTYVERTLSKARGILVRLIGGEPYWPYGLATLSALARREGMALAVIPADGRDDERLDALSTVPISTLRRLKTLCDTGGAVAAHAALAQLALASGLYPGVVTGDTSLPEYGFYDPSSGPSVLPPPVQSRPRALVTFYRSYLTAADMEPVDELIAALCAEGFDAYGAFVTSLKAPDAAAWISERLKQNPPAVIVNATAFSARNESGATPLDTAGCPAFQVALSTSRRRDWAQSARGLSPADLAMHVVLPEVDGRLFAGVVSFKSPGRRDPDLQFSHFAHRADKDRVTKAAKHIAAWHRLAATPAAGKKIALILSSYPGRPHQVAHAVGLDALASAEALLSDLAGEGYQVTTGHCLAQSLTKETVAWPMAAYREALTALPAELQEAMTAAWGDPEADSAVRDGAFHFPVVQRGH